MTIFDPNSKVNCNFLIDLTINLNVFLSLFF